MKASNYNIFVKKGKNTVFGYNTMSRSVLILDNDLRQCLESSQLDIDPSLLESLKKYGFIVEDDTNELVIYRLKHNQAKYNSTRSSFLVFTTYACNLACPYCYEGVVVDSDFGSASMSPKTASRVVQFIKKQTIRNKSTTVGIGLYGGEPLLNVACCEALLKNVYDWCQEHSIVFYTTITTNGTLLKTAYKSIGKYLSSVHITLDGSQHYHDKKRIKKDGSGTYNEILDSITMLKNTKEHLSIRLSVDKENRHSMHEVLDDLEALGIKKRPYFHIYFAPITPQNACLTFPTDKEYYEVTKESIHHVPPLIKMAYQKGWGNHLAVDIGQEHSLVPSNITSCDYVKHSMYSIDPLGDVYQCPASAGDTQYCIGKIKEEGVEWNTAYYNIRTRDPSRIDPCAACKYLPACGGGCAIGSYSQHEDYSTAFCNFTKDIIYERIKSYLKFKYPEKFKVND